MNKLTNEQIKTILDKDGGLPPNRRVVKKWIKTNYDAEIRYYPQRKILFWWFYFLSSDWTGLLYFDGKDDAVRYASNPVNLKSPEVVWQGRKIKTKV